MLCELEIIFSTATYRNTSADSLLSPSVWLAPNKQIRAPIYSFKQRTQRRKIVATYSLLYALVIAFFAALIAVPFVLRGHLDFSADARTWMYVSFPSALLSSLRLNRR